MSVGKARLWWGAFTSFYRPSAQELPIGLGRLTPFAAAVVLAVPHAAHAVKIMSRPRPAAPPLGYVGWPLSYHRVCLQHNRVFGWVYIGGLAASAI